MTYMYFDHVSDGAELYPMMAEGENITSPKLCAITQNYSPARTGCYCEARWYAAYTVANHEKRVAENLASRAIENFLPMYHSARRWKDRRVQLQLPLFPGYLFVRFTERDRLQVQKVPGLARLVSFGGILATLPDEEIDMLRTCLGRAMRPEPHSYMAVGRRVRIKSGSLAGLEGFLVRKKSGMRLIISLDLIMRSVGVEIDGTEVEPV
jgi:transcription antitermination factor NusG